MAQTVSVRISKKRYEVLRKHTKKHGMSITWLIDYILDMYWQAQGTDPLTGKPLPLVTDWGKK